MPTSVKISQLPVRGQVFSTDRVPVVDSAETQTSTVTAAQIAALGGGPPADNSVTTAKIANGSVTYPKIQNVTATDRLLGRASAGAGVVEEIPCTPLGRTLLAAATQQQMQAAIGGISPLPTFAEPIRVPDGSAAAPSYTFTNDLDTGIFRQAANTLAIATGGVDRFRVNADGGLSSVVPGTSTMLPHFGVRAWVNFDGTASTPSLLGTYTRVGTTVTVSAVGHGVQVGQLVYVSVTTGTMASTQATVASVPDPNTFTFTHGSSGSTSGNLIVTRQAIRASGNVSSVVDWGSPTTGRYAINFGIAMPDTNYAVLCFARDVSTNNASSNTDGAAANLAAMNWNGAKTTQFVHVLSAYAPVPNLYDTTEYNVLIIR